MTSCRKGSLHAPSLVLAEALRAKAIGSRDLKYPAGTPSMAVMWGPWTAGMAAADPRVAARFQRAGLFLLAPPQGLALLAKALAALRPQSVAAPMDWGRMVPRGRPCPPVFAALLPASGLGSQAGGVRAGEHSRGPADEAGTGAAAPDMVQVVSGMVAGLLGASVAADQVRKHHRDQDERFIVPLDCTAPA